MTQLFTNNASAILQSDVASGDTTITLGPGDGADFPQPVSGDATSFAVLTLEDTSGNIEVVKLTDRNGDILTVERAQEGTSPRGFSTGDRIELRLTAETLDGFQQKSEKWLLRGASLEVDGYRIYHLTDESQFKNFTLQYTTLDAFNLPSLWWRAPTGMTGLSYLWSLAGPDGETRTLNFSGAITSGAPFPANNEVALAVPGVLRLDNLNRPFFNSNMYMTFDTQVTDGISYTRLKFEPDDAGDGLVSYKFVTRDENGDAHDILFDARGDIVLKNRIRIQLTNAADYPTADAFTLDHEPNPYQPDGGDWAVYFKNQRTNVARHFEHVFVVRDVSDAESESPTVTEKSLRFKRDGNIDCQVDPVVGNDLARKSYVDDRSAGNRTILYAGTLQTGDAAATLDDSILNYQQVLVVGRVDSDGSMFSTMIDTSTVTMNLGVGPSGNVWNLAYDTAATAGNFGVRFVSNTSIEALGGGAGAKIERVIGVFPK